MPGEVLLPAPAPALEPGLELEEGGSLVASTGHWVVTYGTSRRYAVTGVTGMMLMPWTYSSSDPNQVEAVTSNAPTFPTYNKAKSIREERSVNWVHSNMQGGGAIVM